MKKIIGYGILIGVIIVIAYAGLTVFSCVAELPSAGAPDIPDMPERSEAANMVTIENTGTTLLVDDYEIIGSEEGHRVFILYGFWELRGGNFVFKNAEAILDESICGKITLGKRG